MAGSYNHVVNNKGELYDAHGINAMLECMSGDVVECVQEMYGMIWWLAFGDPKQVEQARANWQWGIKSFSPGIDAELPKED